MAHAYSHIQYDKYFTDVIIVTEKGTYLILCHKMMMSILVTSLAYFSKEWSKPQVIKKTHQFYIGSTFLYLFISRYWWLLSDALIHIISKFRFSNSTLLLIYKVLLQFCQNLKYDVLKISQTLSNCYATCCWE